MLYSGKGSCYLISHKAQHGDSKPFTDSQGVGKIVVSHN